MQPAQSLLDERLRALADPTRREILGLIVHTEAPAGEIATHFAITRPAVSRHLRVLRGAKLVTTRTEATTRYYRADTAALADLGQWFHTFWTTGLPRLKTLAESEAGAKGDT